MISKMFLAIFKKEEPMHTQNAVNSSSASTSNGADGRINPEPTLIPARDLMVSSLLNRDSSATRGRAFDSGIELSGGCSSDGDGATMSSQNPNVPEFPPPVSVPMITKIKTILSNSTTGAFDLRNKSLILAFETASALITIRFQALGDSSSATLLSSFLVTMVAVSTVFALMFTLIGSMLERVHQALATICSYFGFIWVVLGFFFMLATFVPVRLVWLVWAAGVVVALVFFYSLAKKTCNTSTESTPSSSV